MHKNRVILLAEDVRNDVFNLLDQEFEANGDDAGRVAAACERAFIEEWRKINDE